MNGQSKKEQWGRNDLVASRPLCTCVGTLTGFKKIYIFDIQQMYKTAYCKIKLSKKCILAFHYYLCMANAHIEPTTLFFNTK